MIAKQKYTLIILLVLSVLLTAGCGSSAADSEGAPTDIPVVPADIEIVAEGRLIPREVVQLAFFTSGQVTEVLVEEGDQVSSGDVIARLSGRERLESSIAAAKLELQAAQSELLAAQVARKNIDDDLPQAQTQALDAMTQAKDTVRTAERRVRNLSSPADQADIDEAKATVILARDALDKAQDAYDPYANKSENNLVRANLLGKLAVAQQRYDDAVRRLNNFEGVIGDEFDLAQAEAELEIAQGRLDQAQSDYEMFTKGPDLDAVELADSRIETAQARVSAAEGALIAAQSALTDLDLVAPMDGAVVRQDLFVDQQVGAGQAVMTVADFSQMYAETSDLTEIEVVDVAIGQQVTLVADALPDVQMQGTVESISELFEEKRGDVTYTARIRVDNVDPRLRWGMTVVVTFEE